MLASVMPGVVSANFLTPHFLHLHSSSGNSAAKSFGPFAFSVSKCYG